MAPVTESVKQRYGADVEFITFTYGDSGFVKFSKEWNVLATPTYVIKDPNKKEIGRVVGSGKTEADFDVILKKVNISPVAGK